MALVESRDYEKQTSNPRKPEDDTVGLNSYILSVLMPIIAIHVTRVTDYILAKV
jgi:hypothetical protein